jgi:uncharacterized protein YegP (UPF0339 family)
VFSRPIIKGEGAMAGFNVSKDARGEWRWRLTSEGNNKVIADSGEGYNSLDDCLHGIDLVKAQAPAASISVDESTPLGLLSGVKLTRPQK